MSLGIPYMGSKRKLAGDILHFITSRHHPSDLYDLFGGGGAVSFTAIKNYKFTTHYNELNSHIYYLVEYLKTHKTLEPKFYEWVTREEFFKQCARTDADWYSGFVMSCWSFGNSQKGYLYSDEVSLTKRLAHEFIINGCLNSMEQLGLSIPQILKFKDLNKRRNLFSTHIQNLKKQRFDLQHLEALGRIENHERLYHLQNLQITNLSYENVEITGNNPVIYCDIPYKGTGEYKEGGFDYEKFYAWALACSYPVYISEYDAPFEEVFAFKHRSSLSATNNKKQTIEKIFWNGKGSPNKIHLFDYAETKL